MIDISTLWARIEAHAGEVFQQIKGGKFTYIIDQGHVVLDRTNQRIPQSHFEKALQLVPLENTKPLQQLRGPAFIYAIMMDERVRGRDW